MKTKEYNGTVVAVKDGVALVEVAGSVSVELGLSNNLVAIADNGHEQVYVGKLVVVVAELKPAEKVAIWSYVAPGVLFVMTFFALQKVTGNLGIAMTVAVLTLIPYYSILWVIGWRSRGTIKLSLK